MRSRTRDRQPNMGGGLNLSDDQTQVQPNQLLKAVNTRLSDLGRIASRRGPTIRTHASALGGGAPIRGGTSWQDSAFVREYVMANGQLYRGVYALGMSWTAIGAGGFASGVAPGMAVFRDAGLNRVLYIADGGPLNKVTSGDVLSLDLAGTPNVTDLCVHNHRLFGITGTNDTVYASALDNGDSLGVVASKGVVARITSFGDQQVTALRSLRSSLLIFHVSGISRWQGFSIDDISIQAGAQGISGDVGTLAPRAILEIEGNLVFPSDRGFFAATENGVQAISTPIEGVLRGLDQSLVGRIRAVHHRAFREALWFLPGYGVYVWNYRTNTWTGPWTGAYNEADLYSAWDSRDPQNRPTLLWGGADGFVRTSDPYTSVRHRDDMLSDGSGGDPIVWDVQFAPKYFGDDTSTKSLRRAFVSYAGMGSTSGYFWTRMGSDYDQQLLDVTGGVPTWDPALTWDPAETWGGSSAREPIEVPVAGVGTYADSGIVDDGEGPSLVAAVSYEAFTMGGR